MAPTSWPGHPTWPNADRVPVVCAYCGAACFTYTKGGKTYYAGHADERMGSDVPCSHEEQEVPERPRKYVHSERPDRVGLER
jgi:hypothetical protein